MNALMIGDLNIRASTMVPESMLEMKMAMDSVKSIHSFITLVESLVK